MAGDHRIELAAPSDAESIDAVAREVVEPDLVGAWRQKAAQAMADLNANVAVVREDGGLVAFGIMEYSEDESRLVLLAVTPRRQRQGIGSELLAWLEETAFVAGARSVAAEIRREDSAARRFLRRAGYRKEYIERGIYWKSLDEARLQGWLSRGSARGDA